MGLCKPCVYMPSPKRAAVGSIWVCVSPSKGDVKPELRDLVCCIPGAVRQGLWRRWGECCPWRDMTGAGGLFSSHGKI